MRLLGDRVAIKQDVASNVTSGGIYLPDTAMEARNERKGTVVVASKDSAYNEGDRVIFGVGAGTELELHGEKVLMMSSSDVLAKV